MVSLTEGGGLEEKMEARTSERRGKKRVEERGGKDRRDSTKKRG